MLNPSTLLEDIGIYSHGFTTLGKLLTADYEFNITIKDIGKFLTAFPVFDIPNAHLLAGPSGPYIKLSTNRLAINPSVDKTICFRKNLAQIADYSIEPCISLATGTISPFFTYSTKSQTTSTSKGKQFAKVSDYRSTKLATAKVNLWWSDAPAIAVASAKKKYLVSNANPLSVIINSKGKDTLGYFIHDLTAAPEWNINTSFFTPSDIKTLTAWHNAGTLTNLSVLGGSTSWTSILTAMRPLKEVIRPASYSATNFAYKPTLFYTNKPFSYFLAQPEFWDELSKVDTSMFKFLSTLALDPDLQTEVFSNIALRLLTK